MTTIEKLRLAKELMKTAENILDEIEIDSQNKSLLSYYGYSIEIIKHELNKLSDNSNNYDVNLERIIHSLDEDWNDDSIDDDTEPSTYLKDLEYSI